LPVGEVEVGYLAVADLSFVLSLTTPRCSTITVGRDEHTFKMKILNFTDSYALWSTMQSDDEGARYCDLWRSVWMRTSSRAVEMAFSMMGLFRVELEPYAFDENDRHGATIALAQRNT
jgi:hypothetical protein